MKKLIIASMVCLPLFTGCLGKCNSPHEGDTREVNSEEVNLEKKEDDLIQQDETREIIEADSITLDTAEIFRQ